VISAYPTAIARRGIQQLKIMLLSESLVNPLERYLREDALFNLYLLYDLLFFRSTKATFYVALQGGEIDGTLLVFAGHPYPIVWVEGSVDAVRELVQVPKLERALFNVGTDLVEVLENAFTFTARYLMDYMVAKRDHARPVIRHEVRKLRSDDAYAYATLRSSLQGGQRPSREEIRAGDDFIANNSVYGVFMGGQIVATAASHVKLPEGWAIGGVFTNPKYRGMGMATSTSSAVLQEAFAHTESVVLFVRSDNLPAKHVYDKLGFKKLGERVWLDHGTGITP